MKKIGAAALILCSMPGAFALTSAVSEPLLTKNAGSAGSDGKGDHMAPGEVENDDPVTNGGPNFAAKARRDAERAADGY